MWTANRASQPQRPQHTASISIASVRSNSSRPTSVASLQLSRQVSRGYESDQSSDTAAEDDFNNNTMPAMWQSRRQESGSAVNRLSQKFGGVTPTTPAPLRTSHSQLDVHEISPDDDTRSRSSTLNGDDRDFEFPEKPLNVLPKQQIKMDKVLEDFPAPVQSRTDPTHVPGPLESQLAALMSKIVFMERKNPVVSVTPEDYEDMSARLKALEAEKKQWTKRHEAIWALRDEDVENNIKIRGMLAKARRELEGMTKLRDEDLLNVQVVRIKLADATRQLERLQQSPSGRTSPSTRRPGSMFMERRDTADLFAVAKAAALEQRALELEKRNTDLLSQIESLKGGASIDDLNRMTAHQAWKDTVEKLEQKLKSRDAEILRLRGGGAVVSAGGAPSSSEWQRVEMLHEEHGAYRERMGGKLQQLRSEKEMLQRELHRKEDECHGLEAKIQSMRRSMGVM
ncbi:hypothetical protein DM02DRAFT_423194 [Periconia macrospinosa]|uniref:Uncharacterized protein n=1 Tax=Periconia macrospinosa TaxID=97972 RepID=A0A2V1E8S7_9PLEO|nr:hypothetical protein DM02DRAFT_423194 [Periconia macrospinosa]